MNLDEEQIHRLIDLLEINIKDKMKNTNTITLSLDIESVAYDTRLIEELKIGIKEW